MTRHLEGQGLVGPDAGVRVNYRVGRFVKSYLPVIPWRDSYYYLQAQAYWVLANWWLFELTGDETGSSAAVRACDEMLARRRPDGAWEYPNPEWAGRVATAEGTWAALGLLESFRRTGDERFLDGAMRWRDFLDRSIGYQVAPGGKAVHYFAAREGASVPNNSAFVLRFLGELGALGVDVDVATHAELLSFLRTVQKPSGELPYAVPPDPGSPEGREHFQCFQYNAFQCLDLLAYYDVTGDAAVLELIEGVAAFLQTGVADDGHVFYDCRRGGRAVTYHAAAVAAALSGASRVKAADVGATVRAAYAWVLSRQRPDGGFPFSRSDYLVLEDRRSYPRNLAMILLHLLLGEAWSTAI